MDSKHESRTLNVLSRMIIDKCEGGIYVMEINGQVMNMATSITAAEFIAEEMQIPELRQRAKQGRKSRAKKNVLPSDV